MSFSNIVISELDLGLTIDRCEDPSRDIPGQWDGVRHRGQMADDVRRGVPGSGPQRGVLPECQAQYRPAGARVNAACP